MFEIKYILLNPSTGKMSKEKQIVDVDDKKEAEKIFKQTMEDNKLNYCLTSTTKIEK